jgi:uncharacterized protein YuzE
MNLGYDPETNSLYIGVAVGVSAECVEIHDGVVLDFNSEGTLVGIDIHNVTLLPQELEIPEHVPAPEHVLGNPTPSDD